jgi:fibronectin-binding autotransporter adhesin
LDINGAVSGVSTGSNITTLTLDGTSTTSGSTATDRNNSISGSISNGVGGGKLAIVKNGVGTWTLNGNNTFTGGLTVNGGTIRFFGAGGGNFGAASNIVTINDGVTFEHANSANAPITQATVVNGNFSLTGDTGSVWSGNMDLTGGTRTITVNALGNAAKMYTISGVISNGALTKAGPSILTLSGPNTYAGATSINEGTISVASINTNLGGTGTINLGNAGTTGVLAATGAADETVTRNFNLAGSTGGGTLTNNKTGNTTLTFSGNIGSDSAGSKTLTLNGTGGGTNFNTISGVISDFDGANTTAVLVNGGANSNWTLSGNNTFTGGLAVSNNSLLNVSSAANLGAGPVTINLGGRLNATANMATSQSITTTDIGRISAATGTTFTLNGVVGGSGNNFRIGEGSNAGTIVLNNSNTFASGGAFLMLQGGLSLGNAAALNGTTLKYNGGTTLDNTSGSSMTLTGLAGLNLTGGFTFTGSNSLDLSAANTSFVQTAATARIITVNANTLTFGGILTTGTTANGEARVNAALTKAGAGKLVIAGASDYTGTTTISGGILQLGNGSTAGSLSASSAIVNNANLTIDRSNAVTQGTDFSSAAITGTGSFTNAGGGVTTLSAANTYAGGTTISAGTLLVSNTTGSGTGTGPVTVNAGTLGGVGGTISGATTINTTATLAPGTTAGTVGLLSFGSTLTLSSLDSKVTFDIATGVRGVDYDAVNVTGQLTYNGDFTLAVAAPIANGTYDLFDLTGAPAPAGSFDTMAFSGAGYSGSFTNGGGGMWTAAPAGGQTFTFNQATGDLMVVPEPSTGMMLISALGFGLLLRRRSRGA